jgi:hypothetical protein
MRLPFSLSDAVAASALSTGTLTALGYLLFPRLKDIVRKIVANEITKLEAVVQKTDKHDDEIAFVRAAVMRQGEEMKQLPHIAESMRASAAAVQDMALTMREIHGEVKDHTKQLARWDGFMEAWDGKERRGSGRRRQDHDG